MKFLFSAIFTLLAVGVFCQSEKGIPEATKSIDGIVNEVLEIISGDVGEKRDWDAFRQLFLPRATFSVLDHRPEAPEPFETVTLEEFIEMMNDPYYERGFHEEELHKVVNEFNGIANVFQTYYGRDSEGYEDKGINSYHLVFFNDRWWIASLIWVGESEDVKLPTKYLKN